MSSAPERVACTACQPSHTAASCACCSLLVLPNTTYILVVDGYDTSYGSYTLSLSFRVRCHLRAGSCPS